MIEVGMMIASEVPTQGGMRTSSGTYTNYMAHGMGLITHEAPRLMNNKRMSYPADDSDLPLESAMVVSIETTMAHPTRGFIKLEDTILVTDAGYEALGDDGRGWNVTGKSS